MATMRRCLMIAAVVFGLALALLPASTALAVPAIDPWHGGVLSQTLPGALGHELHGILPSAQHAQRVRIAVSLHCTVGCPGIVSPAPPLPPARQ